MKKTAGQEAAIDGLRQYRQELMDQVHDIEELIVRLGGVVSDEKPAKKVYVADQQDQLGLGPQQIVERFLRENPEKEFRPRALARIIVTSGYKPTNPDVWPTQVRNCLIRATAKGVVTETTGEDGKKRFRWAGTEPSASRGQQQVSLLS